MLELIGIDAFYADSQALHGITLRVASGGRTALIGRNGAGKTTLLKSIMNAGPHVSGIVRLAGQDLGRLPVHRRARLGVSFVPEDRRIFTHLTVLENLLLAQKTAGAEGQAPIDAQELLDLFPMLKPLLRRMGHQLSGGQQQLLAVARGLAARPRILLLDEPTEGLAPTIVEQLMESLNHVVRRDGVTLILCEQNVWFARQCTERVEVINSGVVVFSGDWAGFDAAPEIAQRHLAV